MGRLTDKHALVTGASRGIGLAVAKALAAEGARLTLVGRNLTRLQEASAACRQAGAPLTEISPRDLTQRGSLSGLVSGPAASVDILVNNAGAAPTAPLERTDDVLWDDTFALNVYVPFALCRVAIPAMLERGFGRVINVASTASLQGFAYASAYTASKHALLGLTRALDAELTQRSPDRDVSVNAICPGFVDTDILGPTVLRLIKTTGCTEAEAKQQLGAMNAGGRLLTTAEVADAVIALACELPATTRGAVVVLDGTLR